MGTSESDFTLPVDSKADQTADFSVPEIYDNTKFTPPIDKRDGAAELKQTVGASGVDNPESERMLKGFSLKDGRAEARDKTFSKSPDDPRAETSKGTANIRDCAGPDCRDNRGEKRSFGEQVSEMIGKIGQFLQSVLPPEYAQYVQQYLPMAEQFIGNLLNGVNLTAGENGARRLELDLKQSHSIPDVLPGGNLELGPKLAFDMKWSGSGAEIRKIQGVKVAGGEVQSGRLDISSGEPSLNLTVKGQDGQTREVPVPLPNIQELIGGFQGLKTQMQNRRQQRKR